MRLTVLASLLAASAAGGAGNVAPHDAAAPWGGAWGYATSPAIDAARDVLPAGTYRYRLRSSQSGDGLRITIANPAGAVPLHIGHISVALAAGEGFALRAETERPVVFVAGAALHLAAGAETSVATDFRIAAGDDLIVTIATLGPTTTVGGNAGFPLAFAAAPLSVRADGSELEPRRLRPFVTQLAVRHPSSPCTIVTLGDSITEGARGTHTGWRGWPGVLAERLTARRGRHCGVVNMGISGNRLLHEGRGTAAVARFDRDVASVPGVTHLIVLEGINDIWRAGTPGESPVTSADLTAGYRRLIEMAHARGIRVIGGTITPGWGSKYLTAAMEQTRQDANRWIRNGAGFDAVIDFEASLRTDDQPAVLRPEYDSGDHLHPGDAGYEAMGRAVPLSLFRPRR